jgi:mRNA-degrading endonuclease HigB of HigAB toxin-antitoxin module
MTIVGGNLLARFARQHADARTWLAQWLRAATDASWRSILDVRKAFPSADGVTLTGGRTATVFNVCGNRYGLVAAISYRLQTVAICEVMTHEQYTRGTWKERI